ncbi:MAG: TonB family protein [Thermoanaerobaculia bacterium]
MTEGSSPPRRERTNHGVWVIVGLAAVFFAIVAALLIFTGKQPPPQAEPLEELYVIPPSLRLRTAPNLDAPIVANLARGDAVEQLGSEGTWVQVRRRDGTVGWAERSYLETSTDHERRRARAAAIRLLPPLRGEVDRAAPLYAGPGIFYPIIGGLEAGADVTIYTRDHDFYAVDVGGGDIAFAEVDAVDLSGAGAAVFEVAATDEEPAMPQEEPLTETLPEEIPPFPPPPEIEPEPAPVPPREPVRRGIYPGVPAGGTEPIVIDRVVPRYPAAARGNGIEGTVVVRAVVRRNGRVSDVEILKDLPFGLGEAAARAVRQWRFRPATYQGEAIDVYYNVTVNFRLAD